MVKDTNKKSRCPKKNYVFTENEVAELAGCSVSYVKQIRVGQCSVSSPLAQKVLAIDKIADESKSALKEEIERIVSH